MLARKIYVREKDDVIYASIMQSEEYVTTDIYSQWKVTHIVGLAYISTRRQLNLSSTCINLQNASNKNTLARLI